MATVKVSDIIDQARLILQDKDAIRWSDIECLGWIASAYREIIRYRPDANSVTANVVAVAGSRQTLPPDGAYLISVVRNESATTKKAIRPIERHVLDSQNPDWHTVNATTSADAAKYYVYEKDSPKTFYLYPAPAVGTNISIQYAKIPSAHLAKTELISLDDIYAGLLVDYVLYRSYSKDGAVGDMNLATNYANMFYQQLGVNTIAETRATTTA
jgi:hypothetical protein